MKENITFSQI